MNKAKRTPHVICMHYLETHAHFRGDTTVTKISVLNTEGVRYGKLSVLMITAGHRTFSGQICSLSGHITFVRTKCPEQETGWLYLMFSCCQHNLHLISSLISAGALPLRIGGLLHMKVQNVLSFEYNVRSNCK